MKYEIYRDTVSEWRWRFIAANGEIIAVSSEGYVNKSDCSYSISLVKTSITVPVVEV